MYSLRNSIQTYAWGKIGPKSLVAKLALGSESLNEIDPATPYAELWMGTHPSGPSLVNNDIPLRDFLQGDLPFLFKVLSVEKALSIQTHPDKKLAEQLHREDPLNYKDDNHKPEMAIALTDFHCLCGFRPFDAIVQTILDNVYLQSYLGTTIIDLVSNPIAKDQQENVLKKIMKTLFDNSINKDLLQKTLHDLVAEINDEKNLIQQLYSQFGCDIGVLCSYFLNYFVLKPSQALFLGPNIPHAYLSGDCIECMACSDNVVRAGLTPKFKDVTTLLSMLDYQIKHQPEVLSASSQHVTFTLHPPSSMVTYQAYPSFTKEFIVEVLEMDSCENMESFNLTTGEAASIWLVLAGKGSLGQITFKPGSCVLIEPKQNVSATLVSREKLLIYIATYKQ